MTADRRPIEDVLEPKTVNELMLINRIRELQRAIYEAGIFGVRDFNFYQKDIGEMAMLEPFEKVVLPISTVVGAKVEPRGIQVFLRTFSDKSFYTAEYVSPDMLQRSIFDTTRVVDEMFDRARHGVARLIEKERS